MSLSVDLNADMGESFGPSKREKEYCYDRPDHRATGAGKAR